MTILVIVISVFHVQLRQHAVKSKTCAKNETYTPKVPSVRQPKIPNHNCQLKPLLAVHDSFCAGLGAFAPSTAQNATLLEVLLLGGSRDSG